MKAPDITHLQFQIIGILIGQEKSGQAIREELLNQGVKKSGPGFYQLMSRLEESGYIAGWYKQKAVGDQIVKERHYKAEGAGIKAWRATSDFYVKQTAFVKKRGFAHGY